MLLIQHGGSMKLSRKKLRQLIESDMQQMLDDMNVDVDVLDRRKNIQQKRIETEVSKYKTWVSMLASDNEEHSSWAEMLLSSGTGSKQSDELIIKELKNKRQELEHDIRGVVGTINHLQTLLAPGYHTGHDAQSRLFNDLEWTAHYEKEIEEKHELINKIQEKINLIDEILSYIDV